MNAENKAFIGVDVQETRGCCFAAMKGDGSLLESWWFSDPEKEVTQLVRRLKQVYHVFIGIDAPRMPLTAPRKWYWERDRWRLRQPSERGYGRHCEIVIRAHNLANPQFTPLVGEAKPWMRTGFRLFVALQDIVPTYEVFPTASYALLRGIKDVQVLIDFSAFSTGPKDMLDAFVAAVTVREFVFGRGSEVGGGDGLGKIVLPRPLRTPLIKGVLSWPEEQQKKTNV